MSAPTLAVETRGLSKSFGAQRVVVDLDLAVPAGSVFGFLGPNGAGKTTTIRMLLGLITPDHGAVALLGEAVPGRAASVLPRVGALVEGPAFHPYLSGTANLVRLDACDRTADRRTRERRLQTALDRVGLTNAAHKRYRQYSLGMKQRLGIAAALLQPRELLVLDEPTNGLDPQGTREVRHLIRSLAGDGVTVMVSSHLLAEVEQVATHVGIMSAGALLRQGPLREVLAEGSQRVLVDTPDAADALHAIVGLGVAPQDVQVSGAELRFPPGQLELDALAPALVAARVRIRGLTVSRPALEDLFVELTGQGFDVAG